MKSFYMSAWINQRTITAQYLHMSCEMHMYVKHIFRLDTKNFVMQLLNIFR